MPPKTYSRLWIAIAVVLVSVATGAALMRVRDPGRPESGQSGRRPTTATVKRQDFVRMVRLSGTVEAVESTTIATPRLAGPNSQSLVITKLIKAGAPVEKGDLLVEFDRQTQLATALDRRAELNDLEQQIRKKDATERANKARDDGEILLAESSLSRARLETNKNELVPRIQAEKNDLAVEQAIATLNQLKTTYALKRKAAEADLQILKIRRDRAENAMRQAESNAERMAIVAPLSGMAVLRTIWKSNNMAEVQEGEEVRAGQPIIDVVNPKTMRVRARVSQADINDLEVGQLGEDGTRRVPRADLRRPYRADFAARSRVDPLSQGAHLRRPDRRQRCAPEPDARPDRLARRDARARARRAGRAARRHRQQRQADVRPRAERRLVQGTTGYGGRNERARRGRDLRPH